MTGDGEAIRAGDLNVRPRDLLWAFAIAAFTVVAASIGVAAVTDAPTITTTAPAPVVQVTPDGLADMHALLRRLNRRRDLTAADHQTVDRISEVVQGVEDGTIVVVAATTTIPLPPPSTTTTTTEPPPTTAAPHRIVAPWPTLPPSTSLP